jgi:hypothetical protein
MPYRCEAQTLEGFVQQLATSYLPHGYVFFVRGRVPDGKSPVEVDRKLLARYGVERSKWARARRKVAGLANVQYIRYGRDFVLLATPGAHQFFQTEAESIRDARRTPIRMRGYALSVRGGHAHVRIDEDTYRSLRGYLFSIATHRSAAHLAAEFYALPFEPYAPVRRQLLNLLRLVNKRRKAAGYSVLSHTVLHLRRRIVKPFGLEVSPPDVRQEAA